MALPSLAVTLTEARRFKSAVASEPERERAASGEGD